MKCGHIFIKFQGQFQLFYILSPINDIMFDNDRYFKIGIKSIGLTPLKFSV